MQITEVKEKRYSLTREETSAIRRAIDVLGIINNDNDVREAIQQEIYYGEVKGALLVLNATLLLDETVIDC